MRFRTDYIHFFQGRQHFAVRRDTVTGDVAFFGLLNGRVCDRWPSKEAAVQTLLHLAVFLDAYNFARRLKTLRGLTPYEAICKAWADEPDRLTSDPVHLTSGLNT